MARIDSPYTFSVESNTGGRYNGAISHGAGTGRIAVAAGGGAVELAVADVARIGQLETGFIEQLNGSVSLGFNATRSSDVSTLRFDFDTERRRPAIPRADQYLAAPRDREGFLPGPVLQRQL